MRSTLKPTTESSQLLTLSPMFSGTFPCWEEWACERRGRRPTWWRAADTFQKLLFRPSKMHGGLEAGNGNGLVHPCCHWLTFGVASSLSISSTLRFDLADFSVPLGMLCGRIV